MGGIATEKRAPKPAFIDGELAGIPSISTCPCAIKACTRARDKLVASAIALSSRAGAEMVPVMDSGDDIAIHPCAMVITVTREALDAMIKAAERSAPCEACGMLLGTGADIKQFQQASNVHQTPQTHFEIDPQALIDAYRNARSGGLQVLGYFHSHPSGPAMPSPTDLRLAARDSAIWAICGKTTDGSDIRFFRAGDAGFAELSINVVDS